MPVGRNIQRSEIDTMLGNYTYEIENWTQKVTELNRYLREVDQRSTLETAFGYTTAEATIVRDGLTAMMKLVNIFTGGRALITAEDLRVFTRPFHGPVTG